jgi:ABC-2 type transport system permease protein
MRYPRSIYSGPWGKPFGMVFTFLLPVVVVVSVPAETMVRAFDPFFIGWTIAAAVMMLVVSRWAFRRALRSYRSASS